jgi:hypothetical protein
MASSGPNGAFRKRPLDQIVPNTLAASCCEHGPDRGKAFALEVLLMFGVVK